MAASAMPGSKQGKDKKAKKFTTLPAVTKAADARIENEDPVKRAQRLVNSVWFDGAIGIVIVLSAASIGLELSLEVDGQSTLGCQIFENAALLVYMFELGYRFYAFRLAAFKDDWIKFDLFLVILGVVTSWIVEPISARSNTGADGLGPLMILRTARLLRLAKTARLFSRIKEFWFLVRGFLSCASIVVYTFIVFFICIYMYGCLAMELITKHRLNLEDAEFHSHVLKHFATLPKVLFTLMRFAALDNTSEVYAPLVDKDPWLALYFIAVTLTLSLILFNLLGAVVFSSTLDQNQKEADDTQRTVEESFTQLICDLREMFIRLDEDKSGCVSKDEILNINPRDLGLLTKALGVTRPMQVFNALDVDNSGEISINEFFDGVLDVAISKSTVDQKRIEKQVETLHWRIKEMFSDQHDIKLQINRMCQELSAITGPSSPEVLQKQGSNNSLPSTNASGPIVSLGRRVSPEVPKSEETEEDLPEWARELTDQLRQSFQVCTNLCAKQVKSAACTSVNEIREVKVQAVSNRRSVSMPQAPQAYGKVDVAEEVTKALDGPRSAGAKAYGKVDVAEEVTKALDGPRSAGAKASNVRSSRSTGTAAEKEPEWSPRSAKSEIPSRRDVSI